MERSEEPRQNAQIGLWLGLNGKGSSSGWVIGSAAVVSGSGIIRSEIKQGQAG